jgi:eukaryotic-like serine/threonine-protein kinase
MVEVGTAPTVPGLLLDRRLAVDAFGEVWRGFDRGSDRGVAVRVGRPASGRGAAREAALLRRIEHENVVRLRSFVDLPDGRRAVVLDLAPGGDLASLVLRRGPLPAREALAVGVGMAQALMHIHAHGFVHGRLWADHILFADDGRPVLSGVGIPALLARVPRVEPPTYPTPADDVRALGEVLRFAATGEVGATAADQPRPSPAAAPTERRRRVWGT